jgi:hypothetical protein
MERIVDKLLVRYNPDEILDYILLKTAAFAKLNARISVITKKKEADVAPIATIPIVVAEEKAEGVTTSQSEDARRAAGNALVEGQKVEEGKKAKKEVKKKAKEGEVPAAAPAEEQKSEEETDEKEEDGESQGSTIENGSKCKDPYKKKHFDNIQKRREELLAQGIEPEKELTFEKLKDCVENKKMTLSKVAEEFGCKDVYVSSIAKAKEIKSAVSKNQQYVIAKSRGAM